jgi:hypothetical protein
MQEHNNINQQWNKLIAELSIRFEGEIDVPAILLLIGLQEIQDLSLEFDKSGKTDLMNVGLCIVLEKLGYYKKHKTDEDGWPHFTQIKEIDVLSKENQELLIKRAIIDYYN